MSDGDTDLVFETVLDAPPEKIWRALAIPEYRDRWLQPSDAVRVEVESAETNNILTLRWQEREEVSRVTIELSPRDNGRTAFRLTHAPLNVPAAANSNTMMLRAA